jgi:hypothetical protein
MPSPISNACSEVSIPEAVEDDSASCAAAQNARSTESDHITPFERALDLPPSSPGADQLRQTFKTGDLSADAAIAEVLGEPYASAKAREVLPGLKAMPPIPGKETSTAEYQSHLKGVGPDDAFQNFTHHFADVVGAAGIRVFPHTEEIHDGDRLMLHDPPTLGPPPRPAVWAPVEAHVDPKTKTVCLTTLDGHPLRGTNEFNFMSDGQGGTVVRQYSRFQGSSALTNTLGQALGALDRQHEIWRAVHMSVDLR